MILVVGPAYAIQAERRGVEYDESTWTGLGKHVLDREGVKQEQEWEKMTTSQKVKEWAMTNQYKVILGGWATSMALAGGIIWRNKYAFPLICFFVDVPLTLIIRSDTRPLHRRSSRPVCGHRVLPSAS